jgi:hypothetical protein
MNMMIQIFLDNILLPDKWKIIKHQKYQIIISLDIVIIINLM